jgi:hypothetical protein
MRRDESKASFAIIRYNFRTYESGGVMAVIKGRGNAETKIGHFQGTFRSGSPVFSVTGFVSLVELTTVQDSTIIVTIVTFLPDFSPATTVIFCGDLTQQLFLDDFATVNFTQGPTCATALAIFVDCCGR